MAEFHDFRHQLDAAAGALAARRSLYAAVTALAADPFDLGNALVLPVLQRRARAADHALGAVIAEHAPPLTIPSTGATATEGPAPPECGGSHRPYPDPLLVHHAGTRAGPGSSLPLTSFQRLLAEADAERAP